MAKFVPSPNPPGTVSVTEHEAALTKIADEMEQQARRLLGDSPGRVEAATAKEFLLGAVRARKVAGELAKARLDRDHNEWLLREAAALRGFVQPTRTKLRRKGA